MKPSQPCLLLLGPQVSLASHLLPGRGPPRHRSAAPSVSTVFSLPSGPSWLENLAYRPATNSILATRLLVPELWSIDPVTREGTLLATVPDAVGLAGITQLTLSPEMFAFGSTNYSLPGGEQPNSSAIWTLSFLRGGGYVVQKAFPVPQFGFVNGIATWDEHTVLAADSILGAVWKVDVDTGHAAVVLSDPTMRMVAYSGVNGLKVLRPGSCGVCGQTTYVYYTSTNQGLLARIPVDPVTARPAPANASAEILATGFASPDDFALVWDGSVFLATGSENTVVHVGLDGSVETVAGNKGSLQLASSTSCQFGQDGVLYVTTGGGSEAPVNGTLIVPASVVAIDLVGSQEW